MTTSSTLFAVILRADLVLTSRMEATRARAQISTPGKGSYNMLGKIFGRSRSLIYRWVKEAGLATDEPCIDGEIKDN
jgi:hypothetical protein